MSGPVSRVLSRSQLDMLAQHGEERAAAVAGSIKRCAIAVGEGATVVPFVHEHMTKAREERQTAAGSA